MTASPRLLEVRHKGIGHADRIGLGRGDEQREAEQELIDARRRRVVRGRDHEDWPAGGASVGPQIRDHVPDFRVRDMLIDQNQVEVR